MMSGNPQTKKYLLDQIVGLPLKDQIKILSDEVKAKGPKFEILTTVETLLAKSYYDTKKADPNLINFYVNLIDLYARCRHEENIKLILNLPIRIAPKPLRSVMKNLYLLGESLRDAPLLKTKFVNLVKEIGTNLSEYSAVDDKKASEILDSPQWRQIKNVAEQFFFERLNLNDEYQDVVDDIQLIIALRLCIRGDAITQQVGILEIAAGEQFDKVDETLKASFPPQFNKMSFGCALEILEKDTLLEINLAYERNLRILQCFIQANDFLGVIAWVAIFTMRCIDSVIQTLTSGGNAILEEACNIASTAINYQILRGKMAEKNEYVPFPGLYSRDIRFAYDGNEAAPIEGIILIIKIMDEIDRIQTELLAKQQKDEQRKHVMTYLNNELFDYAAVASKNNTDDKLFDIRDNVSQIKPIKKMVYSIGEIRQKTYVKNLLEIIDQSAIDIDKKKAIYKKIKHLSQEAEKIHVLQIAIMELYQKCH